MKDLSEIFKKKCWGRLPCLYVRLEENGDYPGETKSERKKARERRRVTSGNLRLSRPEGFSQTRREEVQSPRAKTRLGLNHTENIHLGDRRGRAGRSFLVIYLRRSSYPVNRKDRIFFQRSIANRRADRFSRVTSRCLEVRERGGGP